MSAGTVLVAVVGRPNVGKSTLVNRIVGRREAIVEESPGVTRDRKVLEAEWAGREFRLVDTGGWQGGGATLDKLVSAQAERAVVEADVVLFVVDVTVGPTEEDARVAKLLLRSGRPVVLVVNKVDNESRELGVWDFASLGFQDMWPVSALDGRGAGDLLDALVATFPAPGQAAEGAGGVGRAAGVTAAPGGRPGSGDPEAYAVAIVGRPNVGKSTLFNRLVGDERSIVHDTPGTTRDAIDTVVETPEGLVRFVDTAGLRRRTKEAEGAEYYSMVRALQAIDRAQLALLVIDASEGVTRQDQRLAERVDAAGNPIVVLLNKWDLLGQEAREKVRAQLGDMLGFISYAPVLEVSAKTGRNLRRLYPALADAAEAYRRRIPTAALNRAIAKAQTAHPAHGGARVLYAVQGATDPPTLTLFATKAFPPTYLRYLERSLREAFGLGPAPLKLRVRRRAS
jgi:GTP-binding protein